MIKNNLYFSLEYVKSDGNSENLTIKLNVEELNMNEINSGFPINHKLWGGEMDKFQSGILVITFVTLAIYIFFSIVDVERSSKWLKWYHQMDVEEQKKYDPRIAICRLKKVLVTVSAVGIFGSLLSWFIKPMISIITFGVIMVIFGFSISYIGAKNCLVIEKKSLHDD